MRAAILVCLLASIAIGAPHKRTTVLSPTLSDRVRIAEDAWAAAEKETDPAKQRARWETAADAFALVDGDALDPSVKRQAAQAAVLAWKNVIETETLAADRKWVTAREGEPPRPVPASEQKLIAALDRYAKYLAAADPELPSLVFLKARIYGRYDQYDTAVPIYRSIIDAYPRHEVAAYAASLLLDAFNRTKQYDKLVALANELAAKKGFLQDREDLAATVREIQHQARRKRAEQIEQRAKETKDFAEYAAAAEVYVALYNDDPGGEHADEVLYNAGVMFEEAKSVTNALGMYARVQRYFPNSPLAKRALARSAKLRGDVAQYEAAAEELERYAELYSGEHDARDALSDAIFFRHGLGQHAKSIADGALFVELFASRKPDMAADVMFRVIASYEALDKPKALLAHLREYVRSWAHRGQPAYRVIGHAKLGLLAWQQSCTTSVGGLCMRTSEKTRRTCGTGATRTWTAVARNQRLAKEARTHLTSALELFEKANLRDDAAKQYYARAKLAIADAALESFMAVATPRTSLGADDWYVERVKHASDAKDRYYDAIALHDAETEVTSLERIALIDRSFAAAIETFPFSRAVGCDTAAPLLAKAIEGNQICLESDYGWFDASARCERALQELDPAAAPRLREKRSPALFTAPLTLSEPPPR